MRKSSIYLPDELKAELHALSQRWGRSEAELIRLGIERLVRSAAESSAPARSVPVAIGPRLVGVGVGPSDPDLVTERALAVVRAADRVYTASANADAISRAEVVIRAAVPEVNVDRLVIDIGEDAAARGRSIAAATDHLITDLDRGRLVALVVLGDPNVFSVFSQIGALVHEQRPEVPLDSVPGIMGFQELAARTGTVLVTGNEQLTLLTLGHDGPAIAPFLVDDDHTVVVYKGGTNLPEVARELDRHDRLDGAVLGEMLGLPGERTVALRAVADRPASYLATLVIPARRNRRTNGSTDRKDGEG